MSPSPALPSSVPTQPVRQPGRPPTSGRLVYYGPNDVRLASMSGDYWPAGAYSIVQGFAGEQVTLPRPWVYDEASGEALVEGDMVIIDFLDGSWKRPVVRGVVRSVAEVDARLDKDYRAGHVGNARRLVARFIDPAGATIGEIVVLLNEEAGKVEVTSTSDMRLASDTVAVLEAPSVKLGDGATDPVVLKTPTELALAFIDQIITAWIPIAGDGGAALKTAWGAAVPATFPGGYPGDIGAHKAKAE